MAQSPSGTHATNAGCAEWLGSGSSCKLKVQHRGQTHGVGAIESYDLGQPNAYLGALRSTLARLDIETLHELTEALLAVRDGGGTVFIVGNGGSASTASHMATDFCKAAAVDGIPGIRAVSLPDNVALLTAWGNDAAYEFSFSGPLQAYLSPSDALVAISASGRSPNVLEATRLANRVGALSIGLTGFGGGDLADLAQISLIVDAYDYGLVEDAHLAISHALTIAVRARLEQHQYAEEAKAA